MKRLFFLSIVSHLSAYQELSSLELSVIFINRACQVIFNSTSIGLPKSPANYILLFICSRAFVRAQEYLLVLKNLCLCSRTLARALGFIILNRQSKRTQSELNNRRQLWQTKSWKQYHGSEIAEEMLSHILHPHLSPYQHKCHIHA